MSPDETHRLALALEAMRGTMETGFATLRGDINMLARGESANTARIDDLEDEVDAIKSRQFPLHVVGGLCVVGSLALSVFTLLGK